jgi:hypothetical protein
MLPSQIPAAAPEVVGLGSALAAVITSVKSGGTIVQDISVAVEGLSAAAAGFSAIGDDVKKPENQAYLAWAIAQALEPQPVAPAAVK